MSNKTMMRGNDAIARGAYEAGVKLSSAYPGTPSTEISECLAKYEEVYTEWAPNEKGCRRGCYRRIYIGCKKHGVHEARWS